MAARRRAQAYLRERQDGGKGRRQAAAFKHKAEATIKDEEPIPHHVWSPDKPIARHQTAIPLPPRSHESHRKGALFFIQHFLLL